MNRFFTAALAMVGTLVVLSGGRAHGQVPYARPYGGTYARPPILSPYLNLARTDAPPAVNYYNLVRPQIYFSNAIQNLQQQVDVVGQQAIQAETTTGELTTGHPFGFMTHGRYFQNLGLQGGAPRGTLGTANRIPLTSQSLQSFQPAQAYRGMPRRY